MGTKSLEVDHGTLRINTQSELSNIIVYWFYDETIYGGLAFHRSGKYRYHVAHWGLCSKRGYARASPIGEPAFQMSDSH